MKGYLNLVRSVCHFIAKITGEFFSLYDGQILLFMTRQKLKIFVMGKHLEQEDQKSEDKSKVSIKVLPHLIFYSKLYTVITLEL